MVLDFYCEDCARMRKGKTKCNYLRDKEIITCKICKAKFVVLFYNLTLKRL